jgi:hypothetical protein
MTIKKDVKFYFKGLYMTSWDVVDCNVYCGGAGLIKGDLDRNCCVDANDLTILAGLWLSEEVAPDDTANLSPHGDELTSFATIDFRDFAMWAAGWSGDMLALQGLADLWLLIVDPDSPYNAYTEDDIRPHASIDFFDVAVLAHTWLECAPVGEE